MKMRIVTQIVRLGTDLFLVSYREGEPEFVRGFVDREGNFVPRFHDDGPRAGEWVTLANENCRSDDDGR